MCLWYGMCVHLISDSMSFPCYIMIIDNTYRKFRMIIMHKSMIPFCWKIYLSIDEDMLKLLQPYGFDVGQSERGTVLKGLDLGVQGMRVGGQVRTYSRSKVSVWLRMPLKILTIIKIKCATCKSFYLFDGKLHTSLGLY